MGLDTTFIALALAPCGTSLLLNQLKKLNQTENPHHTTN